MFTTGSKLLIGSSLAAAVFAAIYGVAQGGTLGTIGILSAAVGLSLLAAINVFARDCNVSALDDDAVQAAPAGQATARPSLWPLLAGIGITGATLGLVTKQSVFMVGLLILIAAAAEWLAQGWSERASTDRRYNASARDQLIDPLELPIAGAVLAGVIVFAFSRVMLGVPSKTSAVVAFSVVATIVLVVGVLIGLRRSIPRPALTGVFSVGAIAIVTAGTVAGFNGPREIHAHETTADLAAAGECGAEETHADAKSSQTVAGKSNVAAEVIFDGDTLVADVPGYDGDPNVLTLSRANVANVMFRNRSGAPARLLLELHPDLEAADPGPERLCTAITEDGGTQLLTINIGRSTRILQAEGIDGFAFEVPGHDASLEVLVP